jgi:hypothetical protein
LLLFSFPPCYRFHFPFVIVFITHVVIACITPLLSFSLPHLLSPFVIVFINLLLSFSFPPFVIVLITPLC